MESGVPELTADFVYVRWLGDRKRIEERTNTWDKTVVDRCEDLTRWVELFRQFMSRNLKVYAYANNHYSCADVGIGKNDYWRRRRRERLVF